MSAPPNEYKPTTEIKGVLNMSEMNFCQSCAMPLSDDVLGTEKDGGKSRDYCSYCYKDGAFTAECTMEEMIGVCAPMMAEHNPDMTEEGVKEQMRQFFPTLKRWKA